MLLRVYIVGAGALLYLFMCIGSQHTYAAIPPSSDNAAQPSCVIAKLMGGATTYNPQCERESWNLSTGGRYNPSGWEAALQLDHAKRFRCGYQGRCYAAVENLDNGRAAILLINDNGPLYSGSYGRKNVVIDLNEASMRYLANDRSGARYGNCKGLLPRVSVTLLCRLIGQPGPLNEQDRLAWNKIAAAIPNTELPTNLSNQSPFANVSPFSNTSPSVAAPSGVSGNPTSVYQPQQSQQGVTPSASPYPSPNAVSPISPRPVSESILTGSPSTLSPSNARTDGKSSGSLAAASLVAQPREISRGNQGVISWTSVGMASSPSCRVTVVSGGKEVLVGEGSQGSRPIKINANSTQGTMTFLLRCTSASGSPVERTATLTVR